MRTLVEGEGESQRVVLMDEAAGSSASVLPGIGFNCHSFKVSTDGKTFDLIYSNPDPTAPAQKPTAFGTPILVPFPNRIRDGRFDFGGKEYRIPCNHGSNAIHGFAFDRPWKVVDAGATEEFALVRGEYRFSADRPEHASLWPEDFAVRCEYRLSSRTLETRFEVENLGSGPLPFGLGTHPYFRFPLNDGGDETDCEIAIPAEKWVELEECLPTGNLYAVASEKRDKDLRSLQSWAGRNLDDVFAELKTGPAEDVEHRLVDRGAGIELRISHPPDFRYCVVYIPPHRRAICIEPYTCVTNAIGLAGSDFPNPNLWTLAPGEQRRLWIRYDAEVLGEPSEGKRS